ncbi:MAG: hypothetical protein E7523_05130 [Ruminococcaceae bacterium]|nr:hypothetical protein [Oscillospiraceae bacterium]
MKKTKKLTALILTVLMLLSAVPITVATSTEEKTITSYSVGDIIEFGWYPQSEVTDADTIAALNAAGDEWISYNYYSGTGDRYDGKMTASDYMRYKDVLLDGNKYRGVVFDSYRQSLTSYALSASSTCQDDNGYSTNTVYWFKFDPIKWRVLDPATGMVMSETILDSQAYNNYILESVTGENGQTDYWGDAAKTHYANNYEKSSIRTWLNNDFYNTAFSAAQQNIIVSTTLDNSAYSTSHSVYDSASTSDKIYLLSYADALNTSYGFSSSIFGDLARQAQGSAYAECQGLCVNSETGNSDWLLRSAGFHSGNCCRVYYEGIIYDLIDGSHNTDCISRGVRPVLNFNLSSAIFQSDVEDLGNAEEPDILMGDIDADGAITAGDARIALRASVGLETLDARQLLVGDVDADGAITAGDARLILRCSVGLETI